MQRRNTHSARFSAWAKKSSRSSARQRKQSADGGPTSETNRVSARASATVVAAQALTTSHAIQNHNSRQPRHDRITARNPNESSIELRRELARRRIYPNGPQSIVQRPRTGIRSRRRRPIPDCDHRTVTFITNTDINDEVYSDPSDDGPMNHGSKRMNVRVVNLKMLLEVAHHSRHRSRNSIHLHVIRRHPFKRNRRQGQPERDQSSRQEIVTKARSILKFALIRQRYGHRGRGGIRRS